MDGTSVTALLAENNRRQAERTAYFNPITGEGSIGERAKLELSDFALPVQYIPVEMMRVPLVKKLKKAGSVSRFLTDVLHVSANEADHEKVVEQLMRIRIRHDFPFWAAWLVMIKPKGGGEDVHFILNRPQRRLVGEYEKQRLKGKPIRLIVLKARQWGGSTVTQLYMAWMQLVHEKGLNSLIIAHQGTGSDEIQDMFDRMIKSYPLRLLCGFGETDYKEGEAKMEGVGKSGNIHRVPRRACKIKIGTAERPDSCRGGDYNLVHLSEVAIWKKTDGKRPEDIVRSACSGVLLRPLTMIVYESTANGTGNFFHLEYEAAKEGKSQFSPLFVPWYDIELYEQPFSTDEERTAFATSLLINKDGKNAPSEREESGMYLWRLWEQGATLEALNWYKSERSKYNDHGEMAAEYPSDDIEAFVHSGARVFDQYQVERLRPTCRPPLLVGDVYGKEPSGEAAMHDVKFHEDHQAGLWLWAAADTGGDEYVTDRYLAVVDIGGRSSKADWSVILVIDRLNMIDGGRPTVVAQWYGHIDMDLLAWKAAQIATYYDNALLVIESNTLETHDRERQVDGDQSSYILSQIADLYPNLYARRQSEEDIIAHRPRKYGFHTNTLTKPMVISTLVRSVREQLYTERDTRLLDELLCYERKQNGAYGAIPGRHDDLLMTRAIGLHICFNEMPLPRIGPRSRTNATHHRKVISEATI